jgi:hypothetical protein
MRVMIEPEYARSIDQSEPDAFHYTGVQTDLRMARSARTTKR